MTFVLHHLIEASVGAAVLVPIILLARRFCRARLGSRTIYAAWLLVALRLMLPISLPNPLLEPEGAPDGWSAPPALHAPQAVWQASQTQAGVTAAARPLEEIDAFTSGARAPENAELPPDTGAPRSPLSAYQAAMAVYLAGVLLAAGIVTAMNVRFRVRLARARVGLLDGEGRAAYEALCRENGVRPLPVWLCDPLPSACLVGVSRPFIALPLTVKRADLRLTLLHELSHAKAGDALWSLVRSACLVLFWFHPLVWLGAHASRLDAEMACDERVAKSLGDAERISYAEMLVRMAVRRGVPALGVLATGMSMNGGRMRVRVRGIVQSRAVRRRAVAAAMLLGAALLTLTFATAEATQKDAPGDGERPAAGDEAAWRAVDADVLAALGFPADAVRVRPGACEASYGSLGAEWTVLATAPQAQFAEGTMRFETPGPWTLALEQTVSGASYALTVDEQGGVESYLYEPVRGGLGEVVRTEPVEGIFSPKDLRETGTLVYTTWEETDNAPSRLVRQALGVGTDEAVYGSVYAEVYADGTRVRKYAVRPAHAESWVFRVRMEPLCILSAQYFPEGSREADFSVLETPEEAEASVKDYLARAGWTPEEIDMPLVRTDDGGIYYGETDRNAQDGWYVSYHASRRYVDSFWRADMQKDAQAQRPLTEGERAWAIEKTKAFLQENRLGTYDLTIGEVAVDDAVQRYPDGEVVRVLVNYADKNYVRTDALCIRLEPEAVLKMDYTWDKIDPQDGRETSQAARVEEEGCDEEEKGAPTPQVEEAFLSYLDAVMRVDGYAYTDRSVSPESDGWTMRGQDGRKSFEIHMNAQGNVNYAAWSDGEALTGTERAQDMEWTWTGEQKRLVAVLEPRGPGNERCEWQQEIQVYPSRRTRDARIWWESTALGYVVTLDADTHRVVGIREADAAQLGLEARAPYDEAVALRAVNAYQQVSGGSCGAANECGTEVERKGDRFYHQFIDRETGVAFALLEMDAATYRPLSLQDLRAEADEAASLDEALYADAITIAEDHLMRQYLYGLGLQITRSRVMDAHKREASLDFYTLPLQNKATMEALRQEAAKQAAGEACIEVEVQIDVSDGRTFQLRVDARHGGVFACYERIES